VRLLKILGYIYGKIINSLGALSGILIAYVLLIMSLDVIMRFFFNRPMVWQSDITIYIMVYITFLGTAWLLKKGGHVSIDMLVERLDPPSRAILGIFSSIIGIITTLILTWYGVITVIETFQAGSFYFAQIYIPRFLILGIIPLGSCLLFIQFARNIYSGLLKLRLDLNKK